MNVLPAFLFKIPKIIENEYKKAKKCVKENSTLQCLTSATQLHPKNAQKKDLPKVITLDTSFLEATQLHVTKPKYDL